MRTLIAVIVVSATISIWTIQALAVSPPHTNFRPGYSGASCTTGAACHNVMADKFLPDHLGTNTSYDYVNFCLSCHNTTGEAHDKSVGSPSTNVYVNGTGFDLDGPYSGKSHNFGVPIGNAATVTPANTALSGHMPGSKVLCQTCHNAMDKIGAVENIGFSPTWVTCVDQGDQKSYSIGVPGTQEHLAHYIRVYRSATDVTPANPRNRKQYLVNPSEYTYNFANGIITFGAAQGAPGTVFIYADIAQPYMRTANPNNTICLDCHADRNDTTVSHSPGTGAMDSHPVGVPFAPTDGLNDTLKASPDANIPTLGGKVYCTSCHDMHNSESDDGQILRNEEPSAICANCHEVNGFDGYTAALLANHNGPKHSQPTLCLDCHTMHRTTNILLVRDKAAGKSAIFRGFEGPYSFGADRGDSICEVCHTNTSYHLSNGDGKGHNTGADCTTCHTHASGFAPEGGGPPCYACHRPDGIAPDIKTLMGLGTSFDAGGKASRHIITFDNTSGSSCLAMCHTAEHVDDSPNLIASSEYSQCMGCHNDPGRTEKTSADKGIYVAGNYAASLHNYTSAETSDLGGFGYMGNCTKCHEAHGSDEYPLMRQAINGRTTNGNTPELCFGCHDGGESSINIETPWKADPANPGHSQDAGGCVKCHGPHGSPSDLWPGDAGKSGMISEALGNFTSVIAVCLRCHSGAGLPGESVYNVMADANGSYGPNFSAGSVHDFGLNVAIGGYTVDLTCVGCHDPHNTYNARLLREDIVFSGVSTGTVPKVTATVVPQGAITAYTDGWAEYCTACHASIDDTGGQSPYRRHPIGIGPGAFYPHTSGFNLQAVPLESGGISCISCHYTHGSPKHSLLRFQNSTTPEKYLCLQCHAKDTYLGGGSGSHGGFARDEGMCTQCHNMHTLANRRLLIKSQETDLCVECHGWSGDPLASKYKVWLNFTSTADMTDPGRFFGTGGTFGTHTGTEFGLKGGNAPSMHDINDEASPAPGGVTTEHRCGTCHNPHGSSNYRVLRTTVNNISGLEVYARTDPQGKFLAYSTGFVSFCAACHAAYKDDDDGAGNWIRHPVGVSLSNFSTQYAYYTNNTSYTPKAGLETDDTVSCVTCHFAHGSLAPANLKFPGGSPTNTCKTCHDRDSFDAGAPGSHAGFTGNNGSCSDCHSMHADANAKLLKEGAETALCVDCHDNPGTSTNPNASKFDVWMGNVFNQPTSWLGSGGSFGSYQPATGGDAFSMHDINADAQIAPGDSATVVHCGTCHDTHGSPNFRLLKSELNGKSGINVVAQVLPDGHTQSYTSGMSGFCTACHKSYINYGSPAGYTRHPVNVSLTAQELANYNFFGGGDVLPLEAGNTVMCTTCHFAHGSPNPNNLRMSDVPSMCNTCHAKGMDVFNGYSEVDYPHGGLTQIYGGDCSACHSMHTENNRKLLNLQDETSVCFDCHGPGGVASKKVWRGDYPASPADWDGSGGSFGAWSSIDGGTIYSHHDINGVDSQAPGGGIVSKKCGTCHNPHGNNNYRMLRADVNGSSGISIKVGSMGNYSSGMSSFCVACHTTYGETGMQSPYTRHPVGLGLTTWEYANYTSSFLTHEPKVQIEGGKVFCLSCHFAHGSPSYAMLRMESHTSIESDICQQCHMKGYKNESSVYRQTRYTHGGFNGNNSNCGICHSVHAKNNKKLLREDQEAKLCNNCHAGIDKFTAFKQNHPEVTIDAPSRFNVFSSIGNSFGNYSVGGGDVVSWHEVDGTHTAPGGKTLELRCGKCHNPHGSDNFAILRESVEGTNNIRVFGHLSSTGPFNTYSSGFATFCSACHTRLTNCGTGDPWTRHPVDFKLTSVQFDNWSNTTITPRVPLEAGNQVTCITCHNSHGSRNYSLQRLGGNSMCQQCHKR